MPEHLLFHTVFLGQILLVSYYYPRKILGRMRYVFDNYPPSTHPKLYPNPIEVYERARNNYRNFNWVILAAGLLILVASLVNPHDGDVDNAIAMGYFFVQFVPVLLLDLSAIKEMKLMRIANTRTTRKAELHPRRLLDFISPTLLSVVAGTYVAFAILIVYVGQFDYPWFGGYVNLLGITVMNLFFAAMVVWHMRGKKLNPHVSIEDRTKHIEVVAKIMAFSSIAATVFVAINIALSAFEIRHLLPVAQSVYFQLLAVIGFQIYQINYKNFEVYKEDPLVS